MHMEVVLAEVLPVGNNTDNPLPTLVHDGTKYVVAQPGTEWELRVNILNAKIDQSYRVWVELDRKSIGYSLISHCEGFRQDRSVVFHGFAHTDPYTGKVADRAFKFGALKPAAHAATVQHPDQIQAGRIDVTCEAVARTGTHKDAPSNVKWASDAASKKLPEGKKWFLQPGLQAEEGSTVKQSDNGWDNHTYSVMYPLQPLRLRYDTADNLRLRKILDPSKPQHAAIMARAGVAGGSHGSRQLKQERRAAGVKRERGADQQQAAAVGGGYGGDAAVPRSATAETINLADEAPAPLRVGGRALAADELAVCELAGSDDEGGPVWQVQKKQAIELAV